MNTEAEQRIFISYRRSDCQSQANGLHDGLKHRLRESRIFMDIDSIPPGADFEEHIRGEIEQCHTVLVLIGDEWLDPRPGTDVRRIDEANDFVRLEIESSLATEHVRVIPLLVEGARMPSPDELPESIRRLARLNAFELSDSRWSSDIERLTDQLRQMAIPPVPSTVQSAPTMTFADVDDHAIRYALSALPSTFKTKDLSEHPAVLATHTEVSQLRNYHTIIGRYLMQHRGGLGLDEPDRPVDDRGSVWNKATSRQSPAEPVDTGSGLVTAQAARNVAPSRASDARPVTRRTLWIGWLMVALPILTFGVAAWAPPLWIASKRKYDPAFRRKMFAASALFALGFVVAVAIPTEESADGTSTGTASDASLAVVLVTMLASAILAAVHRSPVDDFPGAEDQLRRREHRDRYRRLVLTDRQLAGSILVGRPDCARDYDDGGLLDLNSLSSEALVTHGGLTRDEATQLVEVRGQLGRFADLNELQAYVDLSEPTAGRVRELAVFV